MEINYSFIIPHKNAPELLRRCIASIPQREDVQIIVVDDNSEKEKKPVVERENVMIVEIDSKDSKGAGHARNIGLSQAKGKWILFADADDAFSPNLKTLMEQNENSDAQVVYYGFTKIQGDKAYKVKRWERKETINNNQQFAMKFGFTEPWNKMVKHDFIKRHNILFEECPVGNDIFYTYQVGYFVKGNFEVFPEPVYNYYVTSGSIVHKKKNTEQYYVTICKHVYQCNAFWKYIGRKRHSKNMLKKLTAIWMKKGTGQFFFALRVYLSHYYEILSDRNKFVNHFKKQ